MKRIRMIKKQIDRSFLFLILLVCFSCSHSVESAENSSSAEESRIIVTRREDGTRSSVNQVDSADIVHGMRITYYGDGKTIYSKLTIDHGIKQGPCIKYYNNGQVFEHSNFKDGKKHGTIRKYYKNGELLAEFEYENGIALPGIREYDKHGKLISSYPEVQFNEIDNLDTKNWIDLEISCTKKSSRIKYYVLQREALETSRVYLITENGNASMRFYVKPGDNIDRKIEIVAEIPTDLGNVMVKELSYNLTAVNSK